MGPLALSGTSSEEGQEMGVGVWGFILPFQHPNLPLFTLKDILLPSCTGSLYITYFLYRCALGHSFP